MKEGKKLPTLIRFECRWLFKWSLCIGGHVEHFTSGLFIFINHKVKLRFLLEKNFLKAVRSYLSFSIDQFHSFLKYL